MCVLDGQTAIFPPVIPQEAQLVPHNQLLAHLFHVLTKFQAMQRFEINPSKNNTVHSLLELKFPPLKSTNNMPAPYVTPRTIGYIHSIIVDSITLFNSDGCNTRALSNENMILEVLNKKDKAVFRKESAPSPNTTKRSFQCPALGDGPSPSTSTA